MVKRKVYTVNGKKGRTGRVVVIGLVVSLVTGSFLGLVEGFFLVIGLFLSLGCVTVLILVLGSVLDLGLVTGLIFGVIAFYIAIDVIKDK